MKEIRYSIIEFTKININKNNNNYIIGQFDIKEDKQKIRIINSYEQFKTEYGAIFEYQKIYENEKEIKKNCKILINNGPIQFSYFHKFDKKGKYNIKYIFKTNITKTDYMFYGCSSLININLSKFNSSNVTNMGYMFYGCASLENIDLSNFNTNNVTDMSGIFGGCTSLKKIDLSNFNTKKVTDMRAMFQDCELLTSLNLSNFNIHNVKNLNGMFDGCTNLNKNFIIAKDKTILENYDYAILKKYK